MIGTELFVIKFTQLSPSGNEYKHETKLKTSKCKFFLKSSIVIWSQKSKICLKTFFGLERSSELKLWHFFLILNLKTIVWILMTFWGLLFCQKWAWVEDWKKILCQHHHNIQVYNIFFQSSSLDQKDHEIRRLMERKEIICRIVECNVPYFYEKSFQKLEIGIQSAMWREGKTISLGIIFTFNHSMMLHMRSHIVIILFMWEWGCSCNETDESII